MATKYDYAVLIDGVDATAVFNKMGGPAVAQRFLSGDFVLVEAPKPEPPPEPVLDFTISVDRSVKPIYPDWMKEVMHPELELAGPTEYDLSKVEKWLARGQGTGVVTGNTIYKELQTKNALADQLGLADLLAIQAKGLAVFRSLYNGKAVFGWKSVVQDHHGILFVPCLIENGGKVVVRWVWLDYYWSSRSPALRFSK
ncbi:MAG: hypothetical protein QG589_425 [Patescibacteria group bacterium]|nr:hypothetical protein [Patescibacteria group bacterium]